MGSKLGFNKRLQFCGIERWERNFTTIKKNCGRAFHSQRVGALAIQEDAPFNYFTAVVSPELLQVQTDLGCIRFEYRAHIKSVVPVFLVFINHIVHFPEFSLKTGSLGGTRGRERMHMSGHEGKLTKDYAQLR